MKKKLGRDYFLFEDEERVERRTVKGTGRRVWILKGQKKNDGSDVLHQYDMWMGWACNIYGKSYGIYFLIDDQSLPEQQTEEIIELLLEQAHMTIRQIQFDTFETEKMEYVNRLKEKVESYMNIELKTKKEKATMNKVLECLEKTSQEEAMMAYIRIFKGHDEKGIEYDTQGDNYKD